MARVCRDVMKELKSIAPQLSRPGGRDNTKGAQEQLCRFYRDLRIIDNSLNDRIIDTSLHGGSGWDSPADDS